MFINSLSQNQFFRPVTFDKWVMDVMGTFLVPPYEMSFFCWTPPGHPQCVNIGRCSPILALVYFSSNTHCFQS